MDIQRFRRLMNSWKERYGNNPMSSVDCFTAYSALECLLEEVTRLQTKHSNFVKAVEDAASFGAEEERQQIVSYLRDNVFDDDLEEYLVNIEEGKHL